jgi:hypothetical protein
MTTMIWLFQYGEADGGETIRELEGEARPHVGCGV